MPSPHAQPRLYRVRFFASDGEVNARDTHLVALNLTPGPALARAKSELDNLLRSLAAVDDPATTATGHYLKVTDVETGETFKWLPR